jgi:predicted aspartyl protease
MRLRAASPIALLLTLAGCATPPHDPVQSRGTPVKTTELKFHYAGPNLPLILVPTSVNGQGPFDFILDTGNAAGVPFLLSQRLARRLSVTTAQTPVPGTFAVGGGQAKMFLGYVQSVALGDFTSGASPVGVTEILDNLSQRIGTNLDGNIGYAFLKDFRLTIDYPRSVLRLDRAGEARSARPGDAKPVGFHLGAKKPLIVVSVLVNGRGPYPFALDTGAGSSGISPVHAKELGLADRGKLSVMGGAGVVSGYISSIDSLQIGETRMTDLNVAVADFFAPLSEAVGQPIAGVVGHNALRQFEVIIDYPAQTIQFKRGAGPAM